MNTFPENIGFKELTRENFTDWSQRTSNDRWWEFYEYKLFYDWMYQNYMLYNENDLVWGNWLMVFNVDQSNGKYEKEIYHKYIITHVSNIRKISLDKLLDLLY